LTESGFAAVHSGKPTAYRASLLFQSEATPRTIRGVASRKARWFTARQSLTAMRWGKATMVHATLLMWFSASDLLPVGWG